MKRLFSISSLVILIILFGKVAYKANNEILIQVGESLDLAKVEPRDVIIYKNTSKSVLTLKTIPGNYTWPGITIDIPTTSQNMANYTFFTTEVKNNGTLPLKIYFRIDDLDGQKYTAFINLAGNESETWYIRPIKKDNKTEDIARPILFGMKTVPPWGKTEKSTSLRPIAMDKITQILVFVDRSEMGEEASFDLGNIHVGGEGVSTSNSQPLYPFVDTFGQYKHSEWPEKVHSIDELRQNRAIENNQLSEISPPTDWDQFGGWQEGPQLENTGYFRTHHYKGKWYLVDPEGRLFFSIGPARIDYNEHTPIDGRGKWFEKLPNKYSSFADCYSTNQLASSGYYAQKSITSYNFYRGNLKLKYGANWEEGYANMVYNRLPRWGMNTIGNWSSQKIYKAGKVPYVVGISNYGKKISSTNGFFDVFDTSFTNGLRDRIRQETGTSANDALCIGYFIDNELNWGDERSLARACLSSLATQPGKQIFIKDLQAKYQRIEELNLAWNTSYSSWQDLLNSTRFPNSTAEFEEDLHVFNQKFIETYFETCRNAVKEVAPNQLYLGCRFASANSDAIRYAQQYCDVVSFNVYAYSPTAKKWLSEVTSKPIIIGEFHFGVIDRGGVGDGMVSVKDQKDRASAFKKYVMVCLNNPLIIGCHWFQFVDQPLTGSTWTEENYQIGFVDIADTSYPELTQASREIGERMYQIRVNGF